MYTIYLFTSTNCYRTVLLVISQRNEKRKGWKLREADPIFQDNYPEDEKPIPPPFDRIDDCWKEVIEANQSLSGGLTDALIKQIEQLKVRFGETKK